MENARIELKKLSLEESLDLVLQVISSNDVFLFKSRLSNLKDEYRRGFLIFDEYETKLNRLQLSWSEQIDLFSQEEIQKIASHLYLAASPPELLQKLRVASFILNEWKSDFEKLPNSHLERKETLQLLEWIEAPLAREEKGIALLVGEPGAGKSVILRDVLHTLEQRHIPVLGIKADRYCVESIHDLEKRLYLGEGIEAMVWALVRMSERIVVLIDQIDALSQSLSARREYLDTFNQLVALLADIPGVRIVISCRTYDLQNDHDFAYYRRQKHFTVGKLTVEEVKSVLQQLSGEPPKLPGDLLEMLRTPLYLDVFCRVYRTEMLLEKIRALQDLYSELWQQKVVEIRASMEKKVTSEKCDQLIGELARAMYSGQQLAVPMKLFRAHFSNELKYLESEGIIQETQGSVTFFHQTFYDFAFAKQFIDSGRSIEEYLSDSGQSLHIRACLKMMIEFLRARDEQEYLRVYQVILPSVNYYFHIKSLLLSLLAFVKSPNNAERQLIRGFVLPEFLLLKEFITAVNSREWLLFLLEEKQLECLLPEQHLPEDDVERERLSSRMRMLDDLLMRHLPESRAEVLEFIWNLPAGRPKTWLSQSVLHKLEVWDNPLTFKIFDTIQKEVQDFFFADFMKKAAAGDLEWALVHLKNVIREQVDGQNSPYSEVQFEHSLAKLIEHLVENNPEPMFDLLLDAQARCVFSRGTSEHQIVSDLSWFSSDFDDKYHHKELFTFLIDCVRVLAKKESPRFSRFVAENLNSDSATALVALVEGFRVNPATYASDIFQFLKIFLKKQGFDATEILAWRVRQLLKESYVFFTKSQKISVIQAVAQIESDEEKRKATEFEDEKWTGYVRFVWLNCLPESDLAQIPSAKETFEELEQRFPQFEDDKPYGFRMRGIGPPMEEDEYVSMTLSEWKNSFSRFDEKYKDDWASGKGGLEQHSRKFEEEVKKRPDFFFPLIEELIGDLNVPREYLRVGLRGLKEAKYDPERLLNLFKKIDLATMEERQVFWLVDLCGYFVNEKIEDDYIFFFLVKMAASHPDPQDESLRIRMDNDESESIYTSGFNTVRGSAVHLLPYCYYLKQHENLLFETLENVAEHDLLTVYCQMMPRLALLTNLDKLRTLHLFLRLTRDNEAVVMEHSAWSAQYLTRYDFDKMKPYFENAFAHPNLHKDMGIILALTWIFERNDDALPLLNRFFHQSDKAKAGAIEVAAHNILDVAGNPIVRSLELFAQFLEESGDEVIHAYDAAFHHLKPVDFPHLYPTLLHFAKTAVARKNPRPFYEYLIACATKFPEECIELVEGFAQYEKPDIRYSGYYDQEPLKVVINAYNALYGRKEKDPVLLDKTLRLFDEMLLDDRFRRNAETALNEVER